MFQLWLIRGFCWLILNMLRKGTCMSVRSVYAWEPAFEVMRSLSDLAAPKWPRSFCFSSRLIDATKTLSYCQIWYQELSWKWCSRMPVLLRTLQCYVPIHGLCPSSWSRKWTCLCPCLCSSHGHGHWDTDADKDTDRDRVIDSKTGHFNVKIKANLVKFGRVSGPSKQICAGNQTSMNNFTWGLLLG